MRARVPASSANLGPGFDTLALALALSTEVEVRDADAFSIDTYGEGADLPADEHHLAARVARAVSGHDRIAITVRSTIPVGRGLGSSAALAAAAAAAAGAPDVLTVAAAVDGHPENAAASIRGGLVAATMIDGRPFAVDLALDDALAFVVVIPEQRLPTKEARAALPAEIPHADAAFNLGRLALLVAGLADHRVLLKEATQDRLHQPYRTPLFPASRPLLDGLREGGALAVCWSGAGPSLLAFCTEASAPGVREAGMAVLHQHGVEGQVLALDADRQGLVVD